MLPAGACDTHSHVYADPAVFPPLDGHAVEPGGGLDDYLAVCEALGVGRHVVVQAKAYGDEAATLDAVARIGAERARAVLFLPEREAAPDLAGWHRAGVRGFRFLYRAGEPVALDAVRRGAAMAAGQGWHVIVQAEAEALVPVYDALLGLPCPVVIDHVGRLERGAGTGTAGFRGLERFARDGGWVKLAAPYNVTADGRSDFGALAAVVAGLVAAAPERLVWGINFPHPNLPADGKPDEVATLGSLLGLIPDEATARRIFVENPARLYGF
jgi:D-galactarolactone isomerase